MEGVQARWREQAGWDVVCVCVCVRTDVDRNYDRYQDWRERYGRIAGVGLPDGHACTCTGG
jgi:hypothetical protein